MVVLFYLELERFTLVDEYTSSQVALQDVYRYVHSVPVVGPGVAVASRKPDYTDSSRNPFPFGYGWRSRTLVSFFSL